MAKFDWVPDRLPRHWAFTATRDGWVRWWNGRTVYVCGRNTPIDEVEDRWVEKKNELKAVAHAAHRRAAGNMTFRDAAGEFYAYLRHRLQYAQPEPISERTVGDYIRCVNALGRVSVDGAKTADKRIDSVGPDVFAAFARLFAGQAPSTLGRNVAYVRSFFQYLVDERILTEHPQYGRYFARPSQQDQRDVRLAQKKAYSREELAAILSVADVEERAWIALGLTGAMDNADLCNLTWEMIDRDAACIDYRRRKAGRVQRIIPLLPIVLDWLEDYDRPEPRRAEHDGRVFLTPTGLPLQRVNETEDGVGTTIDYVSMQWGRLLVRAGLRQPPRKRRRGKAALGSPAEPRRHKGEGEGDGRGFRSLRHTFANLASLSSRNEVELVMGHRGSSILLDHYLEQFGIDGIRRVVEAVWEAATSLPFPSGRAQ